MSEGSGPSRTRVRVWDVPTRIVHWLLVLFVAISWRTGTHGPMDYHRLSGYALLALMLFRLYWGIFGSSTAKFSAFVRGPRVVIGYLRGRWNSVAGHNPLGALSVIALLALLLTQITLGLFTVDVDGIESGPLSLYVSFETGRVAAKWHARLFDVLLWIVGLHVVAVLVYLVGKRQNLIGPMFTGTREFDRPVQAVESASWIRLVVGVILSAAVTWVIARAFQF
jgi:cytochrome b